MENTKKPLNGRTDDILGTCGVSDDSDTLECGSGCGADYDADYDVEYDFVAHYREYAEFSVAGGTQPEELMPYSEWVEEMLPTFSIPTELGKRIRFERHKLGEPAVRFAKTCGITQCTLSNIENGKHPPTLQSLIRIADVLGLPLDDLLGRTVNTEQRDFLLQRRNHFEIHRIPLRVRHIREEYYKKKYGESRESYVPEKTEENTEDSKN